MISQIKSWFFKPFSLVQSNSQAIIISLVVGLFVTIFLWIFRPFGIDQILSDLLIYLSGYGLIAFCLTYFTMLVLPKLMPIWFDPIKWNILKNILSMIFLLLLVSIFNWIYGQIKIPFMNPQINENPESLLTYLWMTFSVGIFPVLLSNYILEKQLFAYNVKLAKLLKISFGEAAVQLNGEVSLHIPIDDKQATTIFSSDLICVKAEGGNYVTAYWIQKDELKSLLWRTTLKNILDMLKDNQNILQCHKSFLINKSFVSEVSGNARTLMLSMKILSFEIPVSRSFPRELVEKFHLEKA